MSSLTIYNPRNLISFDTRLEIEAVLGADCWDNYTANIESKLDIRGESSLAAKMLSEIQMTRDEMQSRRATR